AVGDEVRRREGPDDVARRDRGHETLRPHGRECTRRGGHRPTGGHVASAGPSRRASSPGAIGFAVRKPLTSRATPADVPLVSTDEGSVWDRGPGGDDAAPTPPPGDDAAPTPPPSDPPTPDV